MYDTDDNEKHALAEEIDALQAIQDNFDLERVLKDRAGRNVIWQLLALCDIYGPIPTDQDTGRNLGKRDIGLALHKWVFTVAPGAYSIMQSEAYDTSKQREERLNG